MARLGELGRVDGHDVAAPDEVVEADEFHAQGAGGVLVHVRVVEEDVEVERAEKFDYAASDAGGADDADGAVVAAVTGEVRQQGGLFA